MTKRKVKNAPDKKLFYVFRKGKKPGIYNTYDEALKNKHPWDDRPVIRLFRTIEEAEYYLKHGEVMPPPPPKPESKRKRLWEDDDEERWRKEAEEDPNDPE